MNLRSSLAGATSFAHLIGLARPKAARAEDDNENERKDAKAAEGDEPDEDDGDKKSKKGKRAEESDEDAEDDDPGQGKKAEGDEPDDDDGEDKKSKRADEGDDDDKKSKRADDGEEDDDEEEMKGKSAAASARRRERARCAAIFASPHAARNVALAASLAFKTTLTRQEAIAVLRDTPAGGASASEGRQNRNPRLGAGGEQSASGPQAIAASWDSAFGKSRPSARK